MLKEIGNDDQHIIDLRYEPSEHVSVRDQKRSQRGTVKAFREHNSKRYGVLAEASLHR